MGFIGKVVDAILLLTFLSVSLVPPLLDAHLLPESVVPDVLLELIFTWPLAIINLYGLNSKPWFKSTCLIFGSALLTSTTAMVGDMLGSQKPMADKLAMMYSPFIALGFLAVLRGLLLPSTKASFANGPPASAMKKRA
ncbi:hypothetical protein F3Y22_tig00010263pilonHSYRG00133 [Hibiscus syriacus]|uniref:EXPERA domain-containing protein n=1 Tax=Hibiscus syriacus TaxID=106335 RepID=A0A6A3CBM5_HIBSY|nr:hypothetical protein F3Y22_tig00010263pilonHSYRG00133 [Hibiscus syriacus]